MSNNICNINLTGRIGKDPEGQYTPNGFFIGKASLAVNVYDGSKKETVTNWFNLVVLGDNGERFCKWVSKGDKMAITGNLLLREWEDKNGGTHLSPDVTVTSWEVTFSKKKKQEESEEEIPEYMKD